MALYYTTGDATKPSGSAKVKILPHVCNDARKWGAGYVLALSKAYPKAESEYKSLDTYELGKVQWVQCTEEIIVANMIAQRNVYSLKDGSKDGCPPLRYNFLFKAMKEVAEKIKQIKEKVWPCEIHAPKFACGLAGGEWDIVELFIKELWAKDVDVYIYTPPEDGKDSSDVVSGTNDVATDDDVLGGIFG